MKINLGAKSKTTDTLGSLNCLWNYWLDVEALIEHTANIEKAKGSPKWIPQTEDEHREFRHEQNIARQFHDEFITPTFRYSCILMLYAFVERELLRLIENLEKERGAPKTERKGSSLEKFAKFVGASFNVRLQDFPQYSSLCDLETIRNCVAHCHGALSLFKTKDRDHLIAISKTARHGRGLGLFAREGQDIKIQPACIKRFFREIRAFFCQVFDQLNWKVD